MDIESGLRKTNFEPTLIKAILSSTAVRNYTTRQKVKDYSQKMLIRDAIEQTAEEMNLTIDCVRHIIYKSKI